MEESYQSRTLDSFQKLEKTRKLTFLQSLQKGTQPYQNLGFSPVRTISDFLTLEWYNYYTAVINLCCFIPLRTQIRTHTYTHVYICMSVSSGDKCYGKSVWLKSYGQELLSIYMGDIWCVYIYIYFFTTVYMGWSGMR